MREICLRPAEDGGLGMSEEEAEARVKDCNIPLQVGVGLAGGAEVAVQLLSEHLRRNPGHAVASDDKRNGFNSISREAIFAGLRRWYPELIPTVALWYKVPRRLFLFNEEARDGDGNVFVSAEGCAQGDPLGPSLFAIGYHWTLLEMQVRNPSALVLAYLDDTYVADAPRPALEAMLEGDDLARRWSGVESNVNKRQIWAPDPASLEAVRDYPGVRGTPAAPPDGKYAGGTLRGIRVLGAFLGDDEWRKSRL